MQHRAVTGAKACPGIRSIEQCLDLGPIKIVDQRLVGLLGRNRSNAQGLVQTGWKPILDVPEEGSDRGESAIARAHATATSVLDMVQEGHDHVG